MTHPGAAGPSRTHGSRDAREVWELIQRWRHAPAGQRELVALLPENLPCYTGFSSATLSRLRGGLLAAFADTGLPAPAIPFVLEGLQASQSPDEVAGAAIGLRGVSTPPPGALAALVQAIDHLAGVDATVSFESFAPAWPFAEPVTATAEVLRTISHFGAQALPVLNDVDALAVQEDRFPPAVLTQLRQLSEQLRAASTRRTRALPLLPASSHHTEGGPRTEHIPGPAGQHDCCSPVPPADNDAPGTLVRLQDQDGAELGFDEFYGGSPAVVAFFYTRCDNPYKCSLTISKLAALQRVLREHELAGEVAVTAITYDPAFDLPERLRRYGADRGFEFGPAARFFRTTSGFGVLGQRFGLGVNYGASTVNRHQVEVQVLDQHGQLAGSFTRTQWEVADVLATLTACHR